MRLGVNLGVVVSVIGGVWRHPANREHRVRAVGRSLAFQFKARVLGRPTVARIGQQSRIHVHLNDAASRRAVYANPPDHPEMLVWRSLLGPGRLFVDVGANVGLYSLWALDCGARVISFEPMPDNLAEFKANLELNGYEVELHPVALADEAGEMWLDGVDPNQQHLAAAGQGTKVDVRRLDDILGDRIADGVKIDVEGAERRVLKGAERALSEQRLKLIQLEWNDTCERHFGETRDPLAALLASHGYELCRPDANGVLHAVSNPAYGADLFARPKAV